MKTHVLDPRGKEEMEEVQAGASLADRNVLDPRGKEEMEEVQAGASLADRNDVDIVKQEEKRGRGINTKAVPAPGVSSIPPSDFYSNFVASNPWRAWIVAIIVLFSFVLIGVVVTLTTRDFGLSGATVGFESRNSELGGMAIIINEFTRYECEGQLSLTADGSQSLYFSDNVSPDTDDPQDVDSNTCLDGYYTADDRRRRRLAVGEDASTRRRRRYNKGDAQSRGQTSRRLAYGDANWYGEEYPPLLVSEGNLNSVLLSSKDGISVLFKGEDLFTRSSLIGMCSRYDAVIEGIDYTSVCVEYTQSDGTTLCTPPRSIGHYIAAIYGRDSCSEITDTDVTNMKTLLNKCRPKMDSGDLVPNCWDYSAGTTDGAYTAQFSTTTGTPSCSLTSAYEECAKYNAVYDIFYSLTPTGYLASDSAQALEWAQILIANDYVPLETYRSSGLLEMTGENDGGAECVVVDVPGIKSALFNAGMAEEMVLFGALFAVVYFMILLHVGSFWIATCGIIQIIMAFAVGFVFYSVIAWRTFFPFLNLVTLFLVMGVGADDIFVFMDAWKQSFTLLPDETPLGNRMSWTLRRAGGAMLVTTITTAASFFANTQSSISTLKAFGLFTGMVILADFVLMILFIPAVVIIQYKYFSVDAGKKQSYFLDIYKDDRKQKKENEDKKVTMTVAPEVTNQQPTEREGQSMQVERNFDYSAEDEAEAKCGCLNCCCCVSFWNPDVCAIPTEKDEKGNLKQRWSEDIFEFYVSPVLLHPIARFAFLAFSIGMTFWLTSNALQLKRPNSSYMQLLDASHPLELYEKIYQQYFDIAAGDSFDYPYFFTAGIEPIDNGDGFDPTDRGTPVFTDIDLSSTEAQQWALDLCTYVTDWEYSPQTTNDLTTNPCTMFWFKSWMEHTCGDTSTGTSMVILPIRSTCCSYATSAFPYAPAVFDTCIADFANYWGGLDDPVNHGLWFDSTGKLKVFQVRGATTERYTQTYADAKAFYEEIVALGEGMPAAPAGSGLDSTWVSTELRFYALQDAITTGAISSAMLSTGCALGVLLILTRRFLSSLFASLTIASIVLCTVGVFVLIGWELNVIESIIMSVSVGLACDFVAHLTHSFNDSHTSLEHVTPLTFPRSVDELIMQLSLSKAKATAAVRDLGVTTTMGWLTTFSAGLLLVAGKLYFFQQFGIFLATIMAFSISFAYCMQMPILATIGWLDRLLRSYFCKRFGKDDDECEKEQPSDVGTTALVQEGSVDLHHPAVSNLTTEENDML
jgi:hypothetical protein